MADLALLRTFLAVYRAGSMSRAAAALSITQPAVTKQIRALELQLGRRLFARLPRGIAATDSAHGLAREAAPHIDALEALAVPSRDAAGALAGTVRIGGPVELMGARVLPALATLHGQGIQVTATFGLTDELIARCARGDTDLVVATQRPTRRDFEAHALYDETFVLVGAPGFAARVSVGRRSDAALAALCASAPLVAYADDLPILRRYWRAVFGIRLSARASMIVPDLRAVISAVAAGAGISAVPRYLVDDDLRSGTIMLLHEPSKSPRNRLWLANRAGRVTARTAFVRDILLRAGEGW
jgi:DNA-binding transcriptional LysR family regulator